MNITDAIERLKVIEFGMPATFDSAPVLFELFESVCDFVSFREPAYKSKLASVNDYYVFFSINRQDFVKKNNRRLQSFNDSLCDDIKGLDKILIKLKNSLELETACR